MVTVTLSPLCSSTDAGTTSMLTELSLRAVAAASMISKQTGPSDAGNTAVRVR